jgi:hypothetical protein
VDKPQAIVKLPFNRRFMRDLRLLCDAVLTSSLLGSCDALVSSLFLLVLSSRVKMPRSV